MRHFNSFLELQTHAPHNQSMCLPHLSRLYFQIFIKIITRLHALKKSCVKAEEREVSFMDSPLYLDLFQEGLGSFMAQVPSFHQVSSSSFCEIPISNTQGNKLSNVQREKPHFLGRGNSLYLSWVFAIPQNTQQMLFPSLFVAKVTANWSTLGPVRSGRVQIKISLGYLHHFFFTLQCL